MDIWHIPKGERVVVQFNPAHQPIDPGSENFRRIARKIIRNDRFVQLNGNWQKLLMEGKEDMWRTLMV
jgi:hypothetical protein